MSNFMTVGWLDPFELAASLRERMHFFPEPDADGQRKLLIRWLDEEWKAHPATRKWLELRNEISRIKRLGEGLVGKVEQGNIWLELLEPGSYLPWHSPENPEWSCLHYPIRTNPGARLFAGNETQHLLPGTLTLVSKTVRWSATNLGESARVHLVLEFRRKEAAE